MVASRVGFGHHHTAAAATDTPTTTEGGDEMPAGGATCMTERAHNAGVGVITAIELVYARYYSAI